MPRSTKKNYDALKDVIWHGDQYRLQSPWGNDVASLMYVNDAKSKAVVFNYLVNNRYGSGTKTPIRFKGLDPQRQYSLKEINIYPGTSSVLEINHVYRGDFLMNVGVNPQVDTYHTSVVMLIDEVKAR